MGSVGIEPPLSAFSHNLPEPSYPKASTAPAPSTLDEFKEIASRSISQLNSILDTKDYSKLDSLFHGEDCFLRDHISISPTRLTTTRGARDIATFFKTHASQSGIQNFTLDEQLDPTLGNLDLPGTVKVLAAYCRFETEHGLGRGVVRWVRDVDAGDQWKIYTLFTTLSDLKKFPQAIGRSRPMYANPHDDELRNWADYREETKNFKGKEPTVLIVGAGHSGLMTAARLQMAGVSHLVIDKAERTGDSWRKRYHNLVLHDPCYVNTMPYVPYPTNWPIYASKDKMADFIEVVETSWDSKKKTWTVVVETIKDGKPGRRTLHPRHVVQSAGLNGHPRTPQFDGLENFQGVTKHASDFHGADESYAGRKVLVIGTGNSGHDIAHELYRHKADVTMVQRSKTVVTSLATVRRIVMSFWNEDHKTEDSDLLVTSIPAALFKRIGGDGLRFTSKTVDAELLSGLTAVGFKLPAPEEMIPIVTLTVQKAGGFYIDLGTSSLIASRKIGLKAELISHLTPSSVVFADGSEIEADEIIFATGYESVRTRTRAIFGDQVADSIDPIWGYDETGEVNGVWRRTGQDGFWVAAGNFLLSRYYSKLLALQIKMIEEGLVEH